MLHCHRAHRPVHQSLCASGTAASWSVASRHQPAGAAAGWSIAPRSQTAARPRPFCSSKQTSVPSAVPPHNDGQVDKGLSLLEWTNKLVPQGLLVSGVKEGWRAAWATMVKELAPQSKSGAYKRQSYGFTGRIGDSQFPAESGRYHVYVGNACPWCHRVLLTLVLRGLCRPGPDGRPHVTYTMLGSDPTKARRGGWIFEPSAPDPVWGAQDLWEVYDRASPGFTGRCTAPLLVDKVTRRIVSNESSDIMRMLNALDLPGCTDVDLVPAQLAAQIDKLNEQIYDNVGNGVYKSGFATSQAAYNAAQSALFSTLDSLESQLSDGRPFLLGDRVTEADVRLLPALARFDAVYATLFKCTRKRIADYKELSAWVRRMWSLKVEGSKLQVCQTLDVDAARVSYFSSLFPLNPSGIVPTGPTAQQLGLTDAGDNATMPVEEVAYSRRGAPAVV